MPYIGEIRMFAGNFAPSEWAFCDGQLMAIEENDTLFNLIGTTYGGDGQETFGLPDLRGRLPIHVGNGFLLGQSAGVEAVTLTTQQLPIHSHPLLANGAVGSADVAAGHVLGASPSISMYREASPNVTLASGTVAPAGGSQPHDNMQPYLCVDFIIALFGEYPSPT